MNSGLCSTDGAALRQRALANSHGAGAIAVQWLGRRSFEEVLAIQENVVRRKIGNPGGPDELLLLEHEPVYTIGRTPDRSSLRGGTNLPFKVIQTNRGGQATYHGPGQLVGYPILDLRARGRDLHRYLRFLEEVIIRLLATYDVMGLRVEGQTGVWVREAKIASLGVGVRSWISMHGFALNVSNDLSPFSAITPCGLAGVEMTSLSRVVGRELDLPEVVERLVPIFQTADAGAFGLGRVG